jgi:hypothetical protein
MDDAWRSFKREARVNGDRRGIERLQRGMGIREIRDVRTIRISHRLAKVALLSDRMFPYHIEVNENGHFPGLPAWKTTHGDA